MRTPGTVRLTLPNWKDGVRTNAAALKYCPPSCICGPSGRAAEMPVAVGRLLVPPPNEFVSLGEVTRTGVPLSQVKKLATAQPPASLLSGPCARRDLPGPNGSS